VRDRGRVK